jgi:hypothetical protein
VLVQWLNITDIEVASIIIPDTDGVGQFLL